ncbi:hypothetical protein J6O48_13820 [bacterium]|nr:hypothetical protein [bacterium]
MSKAEEKSQNKYPTLAEKYAFIIDGYEQAEKNLTLTWDDIRELHIIFTELDVEIELGKIDIKTETLGYYKEVLSRFNKLKRE